MGVGAQAADVPETIMEKGDLVASPIILKTWMNYSGPQIANPTKYTTSKDGKISSTLQHMDTMVTAGYRVDNLFVPGVGVPVNLVTGEPGFQIRAPFFKVLEARLFRSAQLNVIADFRIFVPVAMSQPWRILSGG